MRLIYIAGPYRSDSKEGIEQNIQKAREAAIWLWQHGWAVICPHMNTAHFDGIASDQTFLDGTMEMLKRCDAICIIPGWTKSRGSIAEFKLAHKLGLQILNYTPGEGAF